MATREQNQHHREVAEKRSILRELYGGLMSQTDLGRETQGPSGRAVQGKRFAEEHGIEPIRRGKRIVYDTDQVAKVIVDLRGMA